MSAEPVPVPAERTTVGAAFAPRALHAVPDAAQRLPADLLYGRLLASAALHAAGDGPPHEGRLRRADGRVEPLPLARWIARSTSPTARCSTRVEGSALDIGCGPGRHVAALQQAGHPALGIDLSPVAVDITLGRGADAILGSVFEHVPDAGALGHGAAAGRQHRHRRRAGRAAAARPRAAGARRRRARRARPARRLERRHARAPGGARRRQRVVPVGAGGRRHGGGGGCGGRPRARLDHVLRGALVHGPATAMTPPGPFRPSFWRSPLRGPWLTALLGTVLLVMVTVRRRHRLPLARRLPARPGRQRDRRSRARPAAELHVARRLELPVRGHAGAARQRRPRRDPVPAGEAVVGDPAAVRVAARRVARAGARAALDRAARRAARSSSSSRA